jgi:hypothetical protein
MDLVARTRLLWHFFSYERKTVVEDSRIEIVPFRFNQIVGANEIDNFQEVLTPAKFCASKDNRIEENKSFPYVIFNPEGRTKNDKAIVLLHGLNERTWEKYLTWAEYLVKTTDKPVILFPIAFHMNRTPQSWCNPRATLPLVSERRKEAENVPNSTFANVALSSRLACHPLRFYASGRESAYNLYQLTSEIKNGQHPLFADDTSVNIFAYSIGAMLSQVLFLSNPHKIFDNTKLFMFCGGSLFSDMNGSAKDIMDEKAFETIWNYYYNDFIKREEVPSSFPDDSVEKGFRALIRTDKLKKFRETFFTQASNRVQAVSLKKDVVMPTKGIINALGKKLSSKNLVELDFPYSYSHQIPFPFHIESSKTDPTLIQQSFDSVFNRAAGFL